MTRGRDDRAKRDGGAVLMALCLAIVPIAIVAAIVVDLGVVRWQRAAVQNAADTAAVAAGNSLSASGSQKPGEACLRALASLRQNLSGFAATDVGDAGGCNGALPATVATCVAGSSTTLTATSGDYTVTLVYPVPAATDLAAARVVYVRSSGTAAAPACGQMSITVRRANLGPFFARIVGSSGQSVTAESVGATNAPN